WCRHQALLGKVFDDLAAEADTPVRRVVDEIRRQAVRYDRLQAGLEFLRAFGIRLGMVGRERDDAGRMRELIKALGQQRPPNGGLRSAGALRSVGRTDMRPAAS